MQAEAGLRLIILAIIAKPRIIIAQLAGSGTGATGTVGTFGVAAIVGGVNPPPPPPAPPGNGIVDRNGGPPPGFVVGVTGMGGVAPSAPNIGASGGTATDGVGGGPTRVS